MIELIDKLKTEERSFGQDIWEDAQNSPEPLFQVKPSKEALNVSEQYEEFTNGIMKEPENSISSSSEPL